MEIRIVRNADTLGVVPGSDISEHYGHRIFDGSWSKQEAREKSILGYFALLGIGLTGIRRVRINSIASHLNVEHAHSPITIGRKCFCVQCDESRTHPRCI